MGHSDLEDLIGTCELCGTSIRHVFFVQHPNWPSMEVGEQCCDHITCSEAASSHMESMRRFSERRKRFVSSPRWTKTVSGLRIRQKGIDLQVCAGGGAYLRVSTAGQARTGLGIEAQRLSVQGLCQGRGYEHLAEFTEVESGKRSDRAELAQALHRAKMTGSVLVIAKLDRLSRNAAFLLTLRDSGVRFVAADMPDANDLTIGVLAVIAQAEREAISKRTSEALQSIKLRILATGSHTSTRSGRTIGRLGNPNGSQPLRRSGDGGLAGASAGRLAADNRADDLRPIIVALQQSGCVSFASLAAGLNLAGVLTPRGRRWHPASVRNVLKRLGD
ncbi:recombinase family protein [Phenylobacterium sp.]|uniref:recombinase family protein n=1 Tax=Phenylobacterium sp. TaxID=1871053 RepID=UPI00286E4903|nr:recombinase family protein [Phenylobacterium sp.]